MLQEYFLQGTDHTVTGGHVGLEIETDFIDEMTGEPISARTNAAIMEMARDAPCGVNVQRELGRQKIELAIAPHINIEELLTTAFVALHWLYDVAHKCGARPVFTPELATQESLLLAAEPRDLLWLQLDGVAALEELCRCSSIQFTVDVNPQDAIEAINLLHRANLHLADYEPNNLRWRSYMELSKAGFRSDRYGGPRFFADIDDYALRLADHKVVMHDGRIVDEFIDRRPEADIELFLRSIWWHYRLRRYGDTTAIEMRPFSRRGDERIIEVWNLIASVLGMAAIPNGNGAASAQPMPLVSSR